MIEPVLESGAVQAGHRHPRHQAANAQEHERKQNPRLEFGDLETIRERIGDALKHASLTPPSGLSQLWRLSELSLFSVLLQPKQPQALPLSASSRQRPRQVARLLRWSHLWLQSSDGRKR